MTIKVIIKGKEVRMSRKEFLRRYGDKTNKTGYQDKESRSNKRWV